MKYILGVLLFFLTNVLVAQDTLNLPAIQQKLKGIDNQKQKIEIIDDFIDKGRIELTKNSEPFLFKNFQLAFKEKLWDQALLHLNILCDYYIFKDLNNKKALGLCSSFKPFLKHCTQNKKIAKFYINYAEAATYEREFRKSLNILKECIITLQKAKDTTLQEYGYAYLKSGENSAKINNISESAGYFKKASEIFSQQKDTLYFLWTQNGLSTLYSNNGLYEEAENSRKPIYKLGQKVKNKQVLAMAHLRAAIDAFLQEKNTLEIKNINLALSACKLAKKTDISKILNVLTNSFAVGTFARQNKLQTSDKLLQKLQKHNTYINKNPFLYIHYTFGKTSNDLKHHRYKTAENTILQLLPALKKEKEASNLMRAHNMLSSIYEQQQKNKKALIHYKLFLRIKDSLSKSVSKKKFAYVQTQFNVEKKDFEIKQQKKNILLLSTQNKIKSQAIFFGSIFLMALFTIFYLWKSRKFTKNKMKLQKTFAKDLIYSTEAERKRISSELHDSIGQNLLLIKNNVFLNQEKTNSTELIDNTIEEVRNISQYLHPFQFEKLGLVASIKNTIESFQKNSDIFYSEDINIQDINISKDKKIFIYRMIQECLNNVEKHSKATACNVMTKENSSYLIFQIKDNGIGFNVTENLNLLDSLGMKTLKERAQIIGGQLDINSIKGKGTTVQIKVPKK